MCHLYCVPKQTQIIFSLSVALTLPTLPYAFYLDHLLNLLLQSNGLSLGLNLLPLSLLQLLCCFLHL